MKQYDKTRLFQLVKLHVGNVDSRYYHRQKNLVTEVVNLEESIVVISEMSELVSSLRSQ